MHFFIPALITFLVCLMIPQIFPRFHLMDKPHKFGFVRAPIPYSIGIVLWLIFLSCTVYFVEIDRSIVAFLTGLTILTFVAWIDDFHPLSPYFRLGVQLLAGLIFVYGDIGIHSISNPFGEPLSLDMYTSMIYGHEIVWLADMFTILWVIVLVNSMNWLDGVSGLTSGVGAIASLVIFILSSRPEFHEINQVSVATMSAIFAGILLVVVCFDFYPPKMLLGDSGSMLIGCTLAIFSIFAGGKIATAFLILGFPLMDFFWVIIQRVASGHSPFYGKDKLHLHDKLMQLGWSMKRIIVFIYFVSFVFGMIALYLSTQGKVIAMIVMFLLMGSLVLYTSKKTV